MNAKEYLEKTKVWEKISDTNLAKRTLIDFAEEYAKHYHETKVKNLSLNEETIHKANWTRENKEDNISKKRGI